jgi:Predicted kinase
MITEGLVEYLKKNPSPEESHVLKKLILLIGIPASGKTTLAQKIIAKGFAYINADKIREELYGNAAEQGDKEEVFALFFKRLEEMMSEGGNIIIDNTNLNPKQRKPILDRAVAFGYSDVQLWLLDMPLELCLERNRSRERIVPEDIVANMYNELNRNGRPKRSEGKIVIIKLGKDNEYLYFPQA